ncbi:hypothetical protein B0H13DRAFT_1852104 [Mycena leptocephala]|nr:hypothetical protein B0H13DRAFT_1852104 [Mycena leptocephala]
MYDNDKDIALHIERRDSITDDISAIVSLAPASPPSRCKLVIKRRATTTPCSWIYSHRLSSHYTTYYCCPTALHSSCSWTMSAEGSETRTALPLDEKNNPVRRFPRSYTVSFLGGDARIFGWDGWQDDATGIKLWEFDYEKPASQWKSSACSALNQKEDSGLPKNYSGPHWFDPEKIDAAAYIACLFTIVLLPENFT